MDSSNSIDQISVAATATAASAVNNNSNSNNSSNNGSPNINNIANNGSNSMTAPAVIDNGSPSVTLTIRLIMQGKEVGSIIGKKGDNIKKFREESGAKINISDGSCPERIVTVTGSTEAILKAFSLISHKFEEDCHSNTSSLSSSSPASYSSSGHVSHPHHSLVPGGMISSGSGNNGNLVTPGGKAQVTLRLIVPASQCGSLIGKGGAKIKEIREITGATIQVASEMLPNSTERAVTISGSSDSITKCIYQICCVMMESPPKGATIPYRPKPAMPPVIFAGGQAYTIQGQYAIPHPDLTKLHQLALQHAPLAATTSATGAPASAAQSAAVAQTANAAAALAAANFAGVAGLNPAALAAANLATTGQVNLAAAAAGLRPAATAPATNSTPGPTNAQGNAGNMAYSTEMTIPNELIGCIIGKGGAKINEIRQLSGATIKISNTEEGSKDRTVAIAGTPESINLAQYLINTSMELHKNLTLDPTSNPNSSLTSSSVSSAASSTVVSAAVAANVTQASLASSVTATSTNHHLNHLNHHLHHQQMTPLAIPLTQLVSASSSPGKSLVGMPTVSSSSNASSSHIPSISLAASASPSLFSANASAIDLGNPFSMAGTPGLTLSQSRVKPLVTKVRATTGSGGSTIGSVGSAASTTATGASSDSVLGKTKADRKFAPY